MSRFIVKALTGSCFELTGLPEHPDVVSHPKEKRIILILPSEDEEDEGHLITSF